MSAHIVLISSYQLLITAAIKSYIYIKFNSSSNKELIGADKDYNLIAAVIRSW